jgi:signal transduction histidine kinase
MTAVALRPAARLAERPPARLLKFLVPIYAAGTAVLLTALVTASPDLDAVAGVSVLLAAATLAEAFPVPIEGVEAGATSFSNVFIAAAAALYGWRAGALVGFAAMALAELRYTRPLYKQAFNACLYAIAGAVAGYASSLVAEDMRFGAVASLGFYVTDVGLLALVLGLMRRKQLVIPFFRSTAVPYVVMLTLTVVFVRLWGDGPFWALLIVPPMVVITAFQRRLIQAIARQRELDKMKDEFVAVVSHELRTPLTAVYGGALSLRRLGMNHPDSAAIFDNIGRESARLARLVEDVLWASNETGTGSLEDCDAEAVIRDAVRTFSDFAPEDVEFATEIVGRPMCHANAADLRRVLLNLMENAIKYSPDGGTITTRCVRRDGFAVFEVCDEGVGVPPRDRERIFDKFSRLDPDMKSGVRGTGLGLYICRELVQHMGGTIRCGPNEGGRGSVFSFTIPIQEESGP